MMLLGLLTALTLGSSPAYAKVSASNAVDAVQRRTELQVRNLLEPLLDKYCRDECKLMSVNAAIEIATPEELAPGFDDIDPNSAADLAASSARVKILIDEKVGPISRGKLLELIQQFLDTLDFPVKVDTQIARFPQPVGSAGKIAELREKVTKQFRNTIEDLFRQFCPEQCLLADYDLQTEVVNAEEAQYGSSGEFIEDSGVAIRIKDISGTILVDDELRPEERANVLEMAKLRTNYLKNVSLTARAMRFPRPGRISGPDGDLSADGSGNGNSTNRNLASTSTSDQKSSSSSTSNNDAKSTNSNSTTNSNQESNSRVEKYNRLEKIERIENGNAVQEELKKFKVYGLIFACAMLSLLLFIAMSGFRGAKGGVQRVFQTLTHDPVTAPPRYSAPSAAAASGSETPSDPGDRAAFISKRYEIERLTEELTMIFAQHPKVAKQVFSRILTEEGVETTSNYVQIFGESVVMDMLRDPSLQADLNELMEFYAKNPTDIPDDEKLDLLKRLHNRTVAGKLAVMGSRSSNLFDFLAEMDGMQIQELVRNESITVKAIVLTQCDPQKRATVYKHLDDEIRMRLMAELSRIDYLPRDYIFNVANALKRKRRENPKLNTEALPGSEVLLTLLERTDAQTQRSVVQGLELSNPESARLLKSKLVSIDTLRYLRDGQLLEVILSLKHDELLQFLKGAPDEIRSAIFQKSPRDLTSELEEELASVGTLAREVYQAVERKVLNRMKIMSNEGLINLIETNDRMLADSAAAAQIGGGSGYVEAGPPEGTAQTSPIKKVAGW